MCWLCHVWLQDLIDEPPDDKQTRRNTVLRKFAFHQFTQFQFKESLENYLKIKEGLFVLTPCYVCIGGVIMCYVYHTVSLCVQWMYNGIQK